MRKDIAVSEPNEAQATHHSLDESDSALQKKRQSETIAHQDDKTAERIEYIKIGATVVISLAASYAVYKIIEMIAATVIALVILVGMFGLLWILAKSDNKS